MIGSNLLMASGGAAGDPVQILNSTFLPNQIADSSRSLTLSSGFSSGNMLVAMTGSRSSTPPALLSGYTNIAVEVANVSTTYRNFRLQYKIANSTSETINWTGAYGYLLALSATQLGVSNSTSLNSANNLHSIPALTGLNTSGVGLILAGTHVVDLYSSATSPYGPILSGSTSLCVGVQQNTTAILQGRSFVLSSTVVQVDYAAEFLP